MKQKLKKLEREIEKLKRLVYEDELTKILNRRGFFKLAEPIFKEIKFIKSHPERRRSLKVANLAIILLDIDDFKKINDRYGHLVGDKALILLTKVIKSRLRDIDLFARYGGEEFIILLLGANKNSAYNIAEEIRKKIFLTPLTLGKNKKLNLTASFGVAELKKEKNLKELIEKADQAMYKAKKNGKNKVVVAK